MPTEIPEKIRDLVTKLPGIHSDDAWHSLVEMGPDALPYVVKAFEEERDPSVALALIRVVNEYRVEAALPFLSNVLGNSDPNVWKAALDSILSIGGSSAAECLRKIRGT